MNKDTSLIRDILTLKEKSKENTLSIKQQVFILISITTMMIITYIFGYLSKMIEDINYTFIMTSAIFLLTYLSVHIHIEHKVMLKQNKKYPLIPGLVPGFWSHIGPYILALTAFYFVFSDLFGLLVPITLAIFMTILVFLTLTIRKELDISFKRFLTKTLALFVLIYLVFILMQGMMISLAWMTTLSIVITLDYIRLTIENKYRSENDLYGYLKLTSKPYFLMLFVLSLFFQGLIDGSDGKNLAVYRKNPIELVPKVSQSILLDDYVAPVKITELSNSEFAITYTEFEGLRHHHIYNKSLEKIFEISLQGYDIVQGSPYVFRKVINTSTQNYTYGFAIIYDFESDIEYIEETTSLFVSATYDQILLLPSKDDFEIIKNGVSQQYDFRQDSDEFEFRNDCDAFIRVNGVYRYLSCQNPTYIEGLALDESFNHIVYYHKQFFVALASNKFFSFSPDALHLKQNLSDINVSFSKMNYDEKSILTLSFQHVYPNRYQPSFQECRPIIAARYDLKGRLEQRLFSCDHNIFIADFNIFMLRRSGEERYIDVIDGNDMSYYAIRNQASILTYLFAFLFIISFLVLNDIQFKQAYLKKFNLFE